MARLELPEPQRQSTCSPATGDTLEETGARRAAGPTAALRVQAPARQLVPVVRLVLEVDERVEHRLEMAGAGVAVELLGEALEVDIGGVHVRVELRSWIGANLPCCDRHRLDAALVAGLGHIDGVLMEDDR